MSNSKDILGSLRKKGNPFIKSNAVSKDHGSSKLHGVDAVKPKHRFNLKVNQNVIKRTKPKRQYLKTPTRHIPTGPATEPLKSASASSKPRSIPLSKPSKKATSANQTINNLNPAIQIDLSNSDDESFKSVLFRNYNKNFDEPPKSTEHSNVVDFYQQDEDEREVDEKFEFKPDTVDCSEFVNRHRQNWEADCDQEWHRRCMRY